MAPSLSAAKMKSKVREQGTYMYSVQPRFNQYISEFDFFRSHCSEETEKYRENSSFDWLLELILEFS